MKYKLFKLQFSTAVHFGAGGLTTTSGTLMADTVFSALCTEAAKAGTDPSSFIDAVKDGRIRISDALPFIGDRFYVPKPLAEITSDKEGDSSIKKALKRLPYIPVDCLEEYMNGTMAITEEADVFQNGLGQEYLIEKAAVETGEETRPYAVDLYRYYEDSGLYICLGYEKDEDYYLFSDLLEILSYAGIGGKISSGYGRFTAVPIAPSKEFVKRLEGKDWKQYLSLSVSLPDREELDGVIKDANVRLCKRSGWVSPGAGTDPLRKRKDIYMFASGSVFKKSFSGCLFDFSDGGSHPVLRYGYPMFIGVN